jgi:hypothetical protein
VFVVSWKLVQLRVGEKKSLLTWPHEKWFGFMSLKSTKAGEYYRSFVNKASGVMTHEINRIFAVPRVVYERVQTLNIYQTNNGYKLCIINKSTWFHATSHGFTGEL